MEFYKKILFYLFLIIVILLGIYLRTFAYLCSKPLWLDECMLFSNIDVLSYSHMFGNLKYQQTAPPLFLFIEKFIYDTFGIKETVLRFFPFLCSLLSIPVFYFFSKIFLKEKLTLFAANFLFCVNLRLIYYGCELKQFSTDVLCFMILFILLNKLTIKDFDNKKFIYYSIITVFFPLMSMPSYFVIAGWIMTELITYRGKYLKNLIAAQMPVYVMTLFYGLNVMIPQHLEMSKFKLWQENFFTLNILKDINIFKHNIHYFFKSSFNLNVLMILILTGMGFILKDLKTNIPVQKRSTILLFSIILIAILCSLFRIYPLYERTALFLLPVLIVFLTKIIDFKMIKENAITLLILIFCLASFSKYKIPYKPISWTNAKELTRILKHDYSKGDIVIINRGSKSEYLFYKKYYDFQPEQEIFIDFEILPPKDYKDKLEKLTVKNHKYWFFYSCDWSDDHMYTKSLKDWKKQYKTLLEKSLLSSYILYLQR